MNCIKIIKRPKSIREGDFSWIKDPLERKSMEFDYCVYYRFKRTENKNRYVVSSMNYSEDTYIRNIKNLGYIEKYGWKSFLKNYPIFF